MTETSQEGQNPQEPRAGKPGDFSRTSFPGYIVKISGDPFKSEHVARAMLVKSKLNQGIHKIVRLAGEPGSDEDGFAIQLPPDGSVDKAPVHKEKFFRVKFHGKSNENDPEDVVLGVNGEVLTIQREKEVVIPGRFKECAEHATFQKFTQLPDQLRKVTHNIHKYPFSTLGEATEQEYLKQKRDGTKKTIANIKKYGFEVTPEMVGDDG